MQKTPEWFKRIKPIFEDEDDESEEKYAHPDDAEWEMEREFVPQPHHGTYGSSN